MVTMKRKKLIDLGRVLSQAKQIFKQPIAGRFYYAVTKNFAIAQEELKLTQEAYPDSPDIIAYDTRRNEIINEFGETLAKGFSNMSVIERDAIINSPDVDKTKKDGLISKLAALDEEFKDVLEEYHKTEAQRNEFLNEDIEVDIKTVTPDEIPELVAGDGWTIYSDLDPMIKE